MLKYLFFIVLISTYILGDSKTIVFAPLPTKDTQELHTQFLPLVDFLEKKLNVKIKIDYNSDYEKLLDMNMLLLWLILKTAKVKFRTLALL